MRNLTLLTRAAIAGLFGVVSLTAVPAMADPHRAAITADSHSAYQRAVIDQMAAEGRFVFFDEIDSVAISAAAAGPDVVWDASAATVHPQDLQCLAEALYFEARGESVKGQRAVAEVILNRVDSGNFPGSVCGVVNQPSQFSYTIGGSRKIRERRAYDRVRQIAADALSGAARNLTGGATYFHTPRVRPSWARRFTKTVRIGSHIFYRRGRRVASN